jgi:c-di-GMP-binding flagellar brake protein YcgR
MKRGKSQERRRHARARIHLEAFLEGETPGEVTKLTVINFSAGGFYCRVSRPIAAMTRLGVRFQFPPFAEHPPRSIEGVALVVRCEEPLEEGLPYHIGACFIELSREARDHVQSYVEWYEMLYRVPQGQARAHAAGA